MRILHAIETSGPGGAENFMIRLAQSQIAQGHQVRILVIKPGWLTQRLENLAIPFDLIPLPRSLSPGWMTSVARLLKRHEIEAVHSNEFAMNMHLALICKPLGIPHVATVHGKGYYVESAVRRLFMRVTARLSTMVAVSHDIKTLLGEAVGIPANRVSVIQNGIDLSSYAADEATRISYRETLGIVPETQMILAIGNLYAVKGHIHLIEAAAQLRDEGLDFRVFVAGRGKEEAALQARIGALGLDGQFTLLGFRDDARELLWASDIFAMPSLSEGLPLSILESLAARRPVVASAVGGIPQVLQDQQTGLLVPAGEPAALAAALRSLLNNKSLRRSLADNGFELVKSSYDAALMAEAYFQLYQKRAWNSLKNV